MCDVTRSLGIKVVESVMKIYTYSQARANWRIFLRSPRAEKSSFGVTKARRFPLRRNLHVGGLPFDVPGLRKNITRKEILEAIRESRERA